MSSPSDLHLQAAQLREQGKFLEALALYEKSLFSYLQEQNTEFLINVVLEKNLALKRLWIKTQQTEYIDIAKQNIALGKIWQTRFSFSIEQKALLLFGEAEITFLSQDLTSSLLAYTQALAVLPQDHPFVGQFQYHLGFVQVLQNLTELGFRNLREGREVIEKRLDLDPYTQQVWLSGAWLKTALAYLIIKQSTEAQEALDQAKTIINSHSQLFLRAEDLKRVQDCLTRGSWDLQDLL